MDISGESLVGRQHPVRQEEVKWKISRYIRKFERLRVETQWVQYRLSLRWLRLHRATYLLLLRLRKDALPEYFSEAAPPYTEVVLLEDDD